MISPWATPEICLSFFMPFKGKDYIKHFAMELEGSMPGFYDDFEEAYKESVKTYERLTDEMKLSLR